MHHLHHLLNKHNQTKHSHPPGLLNQRHPPIYTLFPPSFPCSDSQYNNTNNWKAGYIRQPIHMREFDVAYMRSNVLMCVIVCVCVCVCVRVSCLQTRVYSILSSSHTWSGGSIHCSWDLLLATQLSHWSYGDGSYGDGRHLVTECDTKCGRTEPIM